MSRMRLYFADFITVDSHTLTCLTDSEVFKGNIGQGGFGTLAKSGIVTSAGGDEPTVYLHLVRWVEGLMSNLPEDDAVDGFDVFVDGNQLYTKTYEMLVTSLERAGVDFMSQQELKNVRMIDVRSLSYPYELLGDTFPTDTMAKAALIYCDNDPATKEAKTNLIIAEHYLSIARLHYGGGAE